MENEIKKQIENILNNVYKQNNPAKAIKMLLKLHKKIKPVKN